MFSGIESLKSKSTENPLLNEWGKYRSYVSQSVCGSILRARNISNMKCFKIINSFPYLLLVTFEMRGHIVYGVPYLSDNDI